MSMNFKAAPYATGFGPLAGSINHAPMSYPYRDTPGLSGEEAAKRAITYLEKRVGAAQFAAVVIEPVQGEGGFIVPAPGFLRTLDAWCKANGATLDTAGLSQTVASLDNAGSVAFPLLPERILRDVRRAWIGPAVLVVGVVVPPLLTETCSVNTPSSPL